MSPIHHGPTNPVSRQLMRYIYVSLSLATSSFASSMGTTGGFSLWINTAAYGLVLIHHIIVLVYKWKMNKRLSLASANLDLSAMFPITSSKPIIFAAAFIIFLYLSGLGVLLYFTIAYVLYWLEDYERKALPAVALELAFLIFEIPVLVLVTLWCMKERRLVLGASEGAKWYHLPQYREEKLVSATKSDNA